MTAPPAGALEACPFCGNADDIEMQQVQADHYVQCLECEASTSCVGSRREAAELWNRRTHGPALLAALRLREGFYWIKDSDWNQIVLEMPTGEDGYAQGYQDAMSAVTRGLCVGPNPAANPLPAPPTADDLARVLEQTK